jgi:uncharacterized protein (TIGR03492 family)
MPEEPGFLLISNGYGEDIVASHIAVKLRERLPGARIAGFPTVGQGKFYTRMGVDCADTGAELPSEGFVRSIGDFVRDVRSGFFTKTIRLGKRLRRTSEDFQYLIPVGDTYVLLFTSLFTSHGPEMKIFVNVQTSEWYGSHKPFKQHFSFIERLWTRNMSERVYVRDRRTLEFLHARGMSQARCCGNTMMDCFTVRESPVFPTRGALVGILPGSKQEAYENLKVALEIARQVSDLGGPYNYAVALSPQLSVERAARECNLESPAGTAGALYGRFAMKGSPAEIFISQGAFGDILNESTAVIGTSGTGNEQAAGMGKPVFGFWGRGPQITEKFMRAQKRLLGPSLILHPPDPSRIAAAMIETLGDGNLLSRIESNGKERMAGRGSIDCIVREIVGYAGETHT